MSKIQKALRALSESKKNRRIDREKILTDGTIATGQNPERTGSTAVGRGNKQLIRIEGSDEPTLKRSIDIRTEDLEAAGLLPLAEDIDVITQQFKRIKRPIIRFAFEVDLPISDNANVVMMASALPGAGKSFCAVNLAQSIALERDVGSILVDADVLKPGISRSFGLHDQIGLIDYLVDSSVQLDDILVQTGLNGVVVIPAGRKHSEATELLASRRMQDLVSLLSSQYRNRAVIFDTPPLLLTNEAQVLVAQAGQIVMVIEARVSSRDSVMRAIGMLNRHKPINAILNKSRSAGGSGYQGDDYGYYPYPSREDKAEANA